MFCPSLPLSAKGGGELRSFSIVRTASINVAGKVKTENLKTALFDRWYIVCSLYLNFNFGSGEAEALGASAGG